MKTWGANPTIQEIRRRLRILRKSYHDFTSYDMAFGYWKAIDDALLMIRKVVRNEERVRTKKMAKLTKVWNKVKPIGRRAKV